MGSCDDISDHTEDSDRLLGTDEQATPGQHFFQISQIFVFNTQLHNLWMQTLFPVKK